MSDTQTGTDIFGNPLGTDVQGNVVKDVQGNPPKDVFGNTPKDIYGNETSEA